MLMRWPTGLIAGERGRVLSEPVEIRDIPPTFMHAASASERELDGRSLLALAAGKAAMCICASRFRPSTRYLR
jgi:arylsulfatase A-like enzyme